VSRTASIILLDFVALSRAVASHGVADEPSALYKVLRDGGWILRADESWRSVRLFRGIGAVPDDEWWDHTDHPALTGLKSGWCLVPWGAVAGWYNAVALILTNDAYGPVGPRAPVTEALGSIGYRAGIDLIRSFDLREGSQSGTLGGVIVEMEVGRSVVDLLFDADESPRLLYISPAALEFSIGPNPEGMPFSDWLTRHYEVIGSVDGSGRVDVPWFYRPRDRAAFLTFCNVRSHSCSLLAATGGRLDRMAEAHGMLEKGSPELITNLPEINTQFQLLFASPAGPPDLSSSLVTGSAARRVVEETTRFDAEGLEIAHVILKF
jgi:hypothetical protein